MAERLAAVLGGQPEPEAIASLKLELQALEHCRLRGNRYLIDRAEKAEAQLTALAGQLAPLVQDMERRAHQPPPHGTDLQILKWADTLATVQRSLEPK